MIRLLLHLPLVEEIEEVLLPVLLNRLQNVPRPKGEVGEERAPSSLIELPLDVVRVRL